MTLLQSMHSQPTTDEDANALVVRACAGCEEAYSELARRYFPRLVQLLVTRIRSNSHMDAEDIAQESLARAFQNLQQFDQRYRFSTWLYTIALRIATDHNRGQRRRISLLEMHRSLLELDAERPESVFDRVEQRESADAIWQVARAQLKEPQYTAMWLRFAEDLSIAEIAKVMRKTQVGVRVLLHRARLKMLQELTDDAGNSIQESKSRGGSC